MTAEQSKLKTTYTDTSGDDPPNADLPPLRTFQIRRHNILRVPDMAPVQWFDVNDPNNSGTVFPEPPLLVNEGIECHRINYTTNGDVVFERFTKVIRNTEGVYYEFATVLIVASGTYWDIKEVSAVFVVQSSTN